VPDDGIYLYCVVEGGEAGAFGPPGIGGRGDEVYAIAHGDIGAVVSRSPLRRYPISRENCLTHERAIEAAFKSRAVLPVRFGTIAANEAEVRAILARDAAEFKGLLQRMRGKTELGVKAVFREEMVFHDILERHPEIRRRKEAVAGLPSQRAHWQLVEVGRMVEAALEEEKARCREEIVGALKGCCHDFRLSDRLLGDRMILNAAFLVDREQESVFDRRMDGLGERYGERVRFRYVKGFPPFSFVDLVIKV
jgi:hypothetical protein